jgi:hypothetical protein
MKAKTIIGKKAKMGTDCKISVIGSKHYSFGAFVLVIKAGLAQW